MARHESKVSPALSAKLAEHGAAWPSRVAVPSRPARVAPLFSAIPVHERRHAMSALRDQPSLAPNFPRLFALTFLLTLPIIDIE